MSKFRVFAAAVAAAVTLGLASGSQAQFFGGMGGYATMGPGMMGPFAGQASPFARGLGYRYGTMVATYCYAIMGPAAGYGFSIMGPWTGSNSADPNAAVQACLTSLHAQLGVSAAQEAAWQGFADAVTQQAQQMLVFQQQLLQATATAPERAAQYAQFMQERAQGAAKVSQAVNGLYAVLSPAQQALFNDYFAWGG